MYILIKFTRKPHEVFNEIINNNYIFLTKGQGDRSLQNISSHSLGFIEKTQFHSSSYMSNKSIYGSH